MVESNGKSSEAAAVARLRIGLIEEIPSAANGRTHSVLSTTSQPSITKRRNIKKRFSGCKCIKRSRILYLNRRLNNQPMPSEDRSASTLQRLLSSDYSTIRKVFWFLIIISCTCVCFWQLGDRIKYYFDEPIMFSVTVVHQHEVQFPAITLCPAREPFNENDLEVEIPSSPPPSFSLDHYWSRYEMKINETIAMYSTCKQDRSVCNIEAGVEDYPNTSVLHTFWGRCLTLLPGSPMEYRGAASFMEIYISPGAHSRQWFGQGIAAQFYFQDLGSRMRHDAYYVVEWLRLQQFTSIRLTLKQFNSVNSSKNLCDDEAVVAECRNKCVDQLLDQVVNCSLPFMVSKWPACETLSKAKQAMNISRQFYQTFSYAKCPCRRQCVERVYSYFLTSAGERQDELTSLLLQFSDNLMENVTETYAYSFSALVSDIGGGLGFFLGVSILSLLQAFEGVLVRFNMKKKDKE